MATIKAMIATAKTAWRYTSKNPDKGAPYPLDNWRLADGRDDVLIADGKPPRAKDSYLHVFLFVDHRDHRGITDHLVGIAKSPWHKRVSWRGREFTRGRVVAYYKLDQYRVLDGTW